MARPKRESDWSPITARLSVDSGRRLRVAAARAGTTPGVILDRLIQAGLPPADPLPASAGTGTQPEPVTVEWLQAGMERLGLSQAALARAAKVNPKSVNDWFARGRVPVARWPVLRRLLSARQKG